MAETIAPKKRGRPKGSKNGAHKNPDVPKEYVCPRCGIKKQEDMFYKSKGSMMWDFSDGRVLTACKDCFDGRLRIATERYGERMGLIIACHWVDAPYIDAVYQAVLQKQGNFDFGLYMRTLNGVQYVKKSFITSLIDNSFVEDSAAKVQESAEAKWSRDEIRNKKEVVDMLGADPFDGYNTADRRYLFGELAKYLDEDLLDDAFKLSQVVQIVTNNLQIKKCDLQISGLDVARDADKVKTLNTIKKDLVASNDKIAKENEISVRNRTNKDAGKSTLTYLMRDLRNKDFVEAQANYYDQLKSEGTRWAADMSMKALMQNTMFDENDKQEIFIGQREMIGDLQSKLDDKTEECRLLKIENQELAQNQKKGRR